MLKLFDKLFNPKQLEYFGHLGKISDPKHFFDEQNYIICRNVLDANQIDALVNFYDSWIVNTKDYKYLRQSGNWEYSDFTDAGGVKNCFLNPHSYINNSNGKLARNILSLIENSSVAQSLSEISQHKKFNLYQTMLFDHATTGPHQDWIYLDSRPNGHLIAAWIALENTYQDGIRFYVYPGTHQFKPSAGYDYKSNQSHSDLFRLFIEEINELLASKRYDMYAPPLQKGDVFFWGSRIIHGSVSGINPNLRRRSIAAHFVPDGFKFGNLEQDIEVDFEKFGTLQYAYYALDDVFNQVNNLMLSK
jgi:phytanoyl-CoA hydroxylase